MSDQQNTSLKLLGAKALREMFGVSDMTIWRWTQNCGFPKGFKMSPKGPTYRREPEVLTWVDEREAISEEASLEASMTDAAA